MELLDSGTGISIEAHIKNDTITEIIHNLVEELQFG